MKKPTLEDQNHNQKKFLWCNRRWKPLWLVTGKKRSISAIVPRFLAAIFRRQSVRLCGTVPAPWELFCAIFTQHRPHLSVGHISEQHTQSHHCRLAKPLNVFSPSNCTCIYHSSSPCVCNSFCSSTSNCVPAPVQCNCKHISQVLWRSKVSFLC